MEVDSKTREHIEALLQEDEETLERYLDLTEAGAPVRGVVYDHKDIVRRGPEPDETGEGEPRRRPRLGPLLQARYRKAVCSSPKVREYAKHRDNVFLVAAVMDAISGYVTGLTLAAVSVLFVKHGVQKMCADEWCEQDKKG